MASGPNSKLKAIAKIWKDFAKEFGLGNKMEYGENYLVWRFDCSLKAFNDSIMAQFEARDDGAVQFLFLFDSLDVCEETLRMVNKVNERNAYFHAYIDTRKGNFRLEHSVFSLREEDLGAYTAAVLSELISDPMTQLLTPICKRTIDE